MGCVTSKKCNSGSELGRFENDVSDEDIKQMIARYPKDLAYSFSVDSDKFIYRISNFALQENPNISKIPKKIMFLEAEPDEDDTCCICLEKIDNDCVKLNLCNHKFHQKCIEQTLKHLGESCPMCRAGIDNEVIDNYYESRREISIDSDYSNNSY